MAGNTYACGSVQLGNTENQQTEGSDVQTLSIYNALSPIWLTRDKVKRRDEKIAQQREKSNR